MMMNQRMADGAFPKPSVKTPDSQLSPIERVDKNSKSMIKWEIVDPHYNMKMFKIDLKSVPLFFWTMVQYTIDTLVI